MTSNKQQTIDFFVSRLIIRFRDDIDDTLVIRNQSTTIRFFFAFVFTFNVSSITQSNSFIIFEFVLRSIFSIKVIIDTFDISTKKIIYSQSIKSKLSQSQQSSNQQNQNQKQNQQKQNQSQFDIVDEISIIDNVSFSRANLQTLIDNVINNYVQRYSSQQNQSNQSNSSNDFESFDQNVVVAIDDVTR